MFSEGRNDKKLRNIFLRKTKMKKGCDQRSKIKLPLNVK